MQQQLSPTTGSSVRNWSEKQLYKLGNETRTARGDVFWQLLTVADEPALDIDGRQRQVFLFDIGDDEGQFTFELVPPTLA